MSKQKGFIPLLLVVIFAFLAGVFIYANTPKKLPSKPLNRVYYLRLSTTRADDPPKSLDFIDVGSQETGSLNTPTILTKFNALHNIEVHTNSVSNFVQLAPNKSFIIIKPNPTYSDQNLYFWNLQTGEIKQLTTEASPPSKGLCPMAITYMISPNSNLLYYRVSNNAPTFGTSYKPVDENGQPCTVQPSREIVLDLQTQSKNSIKMDSGWVRGWSGDSKSLIYSDFSGDYNKNSVTYEIESGLQKNLFDTVEKIAWSKDGTKGVYVGRLKANHDMIDLGEINIIDTHFNVLASLPYSEGEPDRRNEAFLNSNYYYNFWKFDALSPDGKNVVLTKISIHHANQNQGNNDWENQLANQAAEVYLWNTITLQKTKLPFTVNDKATIWWTNDSSKLIYHTKSDAVYTDYSKENDAIFSYDIRTKKITTLIDLRNDVKGAYGFVLY